MAEEIIDGETGEISPAVRNESAPLSIQEVRGTIGLIQQLMKEVMQGPTKDNPMGVHYGMVPGCGPKPTLLQPGSQKLMFTFHLVPQRTVTVTDLGNFHREVRVTTKLFSPSGQLKGEGQGVCSTLESKYRYRDSALKCPKCGKEAIRHGKDGGWYCWAKIGGCGTQYKAGDKAIEEQPRGKVEHPDPADYWNTVEKIACKRADVHATIGALAASDIFMQDIEDTPELYQSGGKSTAAPVAMPTEQKPATESLNTKYAGKAAKAEVPPTPASGPQEWPEPWPETQPEAPAEKPKGHLIERIMDKNGKKGPFASALINGHWYTIFDNGCIEFAHTAFSNKTPVAFTFSTSPDGKFKNLDTIEAAP